MCDEAVLEYMKPEQYAEILIEFAGNVAATGNRLVAVSTVAARRSLMTKRLKRIFLHLVATK
jgi:beta-lactamase regulating signal transducer with metallopeptidase domain